MNRSLARFRPAADQDVDDIADHIAAGSLEHALRFYAAVRADAARLAASPQLGPVYGFTDAAVADLRFWLVTGFRKYLMFYRPLASADGVEIVRVLHGARDLARVIGVG
jgi:toxin ParE1/3/4